VQEKTMRRTLPMLEKKFAGGFFTYATDRHDTQKAETG
jgi:hypothetical protein